MNTETVDLLLANRNYLYNVAARAYAEEPDAIFVNTLLDRHTFDEVELVQQIDTQVKDVYKEVVKTLEARQGGLGELRCQYVKIFVGPGTLLASPWETMHVTGKRILFQQEVLSVRESYKRAGFLPQRYPHVADDHIGLELDFLAKLAADAYEAYGEEDEKRCMRRLQESKQFLDNHLLCWVDDLAQAIEKNYSGSLYGSFTRFVSAVAKRDALVLDELISERRDQ